MFDVVEFFTNWTTLTNLQLNVFLSDEENFSTTKRLPRVGFELLGL